MRFQCFTAKIFGSSLHFRPSESTTRRLTMTTALSKEPRRFEPLREGAKQIEGVPRLKGVVFDVDGTLCIPQTYMFAEMRRALSITKQTDILEHCHSLPPHEETLALQKIREIERSAMHSQQPQPGLSTLMAYLEEKSIPKGICTRNFDAPVNHLLGKFLGGKEFHPIITREFKPPKPDPAGILYIAKVWELKGEDLIMVGDSIDDMTAGYRAGAATVLLVNDVNAHLADHEHTDLVISRLDELIDVLERGFVGSIGRGDEESDTRERAEGVLRHGRREGS